MVRLLKKKDPKRVFFLRHWLATANRRKFPGFTNSGKNLPSAGTGEIVKKFTKSKPLNVQLAYANRRDRRPLPPLTFYRTFGKLSILFFKKKNKKKCYRPIDKSVQVSYNIIKKRENKEREDRKNDKN